MNAAPEMPEQIRSYRLDPTAFGPTKRRVYRSVAIRNSLMVLVVVAVIALKARADESYADGFAVTIPITVGALAFGTFIALRARLAQERAAWESYVLTMAPHGLRRHVNRLPLTDVLRSEVTRIDDVDGRGLTVFSHDRHRFIFIPQGLVGYAEVRAELATWRPFEKPKLVRSASDVARAVMMIACWIGSGLIPDFRIAMGVGVVLGVLVVLAVRETMLIRVFSKELKIANLVGLAFIAFAPFGRLVVHVFFHLDPKWPPF
jgi:hypothetical protein